MIVLTSQSPPKSWARRVRFAGREHPFENAARGAVESFPIYFGTES